MDLFFYTLRDLSPTDKAMPKIVATVAGSDERSAWQSVINFSKERKIPVMVYNDKQFHGIVYPTGKTESFLGGL